MLTRWARWPRVIRYLVDVLAGVALALGVGWVLFVPTADWLAAHDVGQVTGTLRMSRLQTARDSARGRFLTFGAGLFAAGALVYTARNFTLSRIALEATRKTVELTEQGQVTDRYIRAIKQLGSQQLDVRIGGIYALERVAHDSPRDHAAVMRVLAVFVREHSREQWPPRKQKTDATPPRETRPDVQAALRVIGRRDSTLDPKVIDLYAANLTCASFYASNLKDADLIEVDLTGAYLKRADLTGADLKRATLTCANLKGADLTGAKNLTEVDLTGADLTDTRFSQGVQIPEGWVQDAASGKLKRANAEPQ